MNEISLEDEGKLSHEEASEIIMYIDRIIDAIDYELKFRSC